MKPLTIAAVAIMTVVAATRLSAQDARPVYVIKGAPASFPVDFKQRAVETITGCCQGSVQAALSCPAEEHCEDVWIEDTPLRFSIQFQVDHAGDVNRYGTSSYNRRAKPEARQAQVLDWLRGMVRCEDIHHHSGVENKSHISWYCQICQLIETGTPDVPPTRTR